MYCNKHYIRIREDGCIVDGFSDAFRQPTEKDVCINEKGGYQFRLFTGGEENPSLWDMDGIPRYKWDGTQAVLRTEEELEVDRAAQPTLEPTTDEILLELAADHEARICMMELGV